MSALEFIYSSFWVFAGVTLHLALVCSIAAHIAAAFCFRRCDHCRKVRGETD